MRLLRVLAVLFGLAVVLVPVAKALDYNDESEEAPKGEVGRVYHFELHSHGGCDDRPYHYVIQSGSLPPGLKLTPESFDLPDGRHTGLIDGNPTEQGTWTAWIALQDRCGNSSELLFTFKIDHRSYAITTTDVPPATAGATYSTKLVACCHPTLQETWTLTAGTLPAGLSLAADGTIAGTPAVPGSSTFTATATSNGDDGGIRIDSRQFTLVVGGQLTASLSRRNAEVGAPFRATLAVSAGKPPLTWTAKAVPPGLTLGADGVLSGIPTRAGAYIVTGHFVDADGVAADVSTPMRVHARLAIVTRSLPAATAGRAYRARIRTRGGMTPLRWRIVAGRLPAGLRLDTHTGTIAGTPASAGAARVTVRARDALNVSATRAFVLSVGG